jgi:hypothetical protein
MEFVSFETGLDINHMVDDSQLCDLPKQEHENAQLQDPS